jgi:hypothetical protein
MKPDASKICFGLTEELDRESLEIFLQLAGRPEFTSNFCSRLTSEEIIEYSDSFMKLLRKYFSEEEYHTFFLNQQRHQ